MLACLGTNPGRRSRLIGEFSYHDISYILVDGVGIPLKLNTAAKANFKRCETCISLSRRVSQAPFGSSNRTHAKADLASHRCWVADERGMANSQKERAQDEQASTLMIQIDGYSKQKTLMSWVFRDDKAGDFPQHLLGVVIHAPQGCKGKYGVDKEVIRMAYLLSEHLGGNGGDETVEVINRVLNHLQSSCSGNWPRHLILLLEGASDNKNRTILAFCAYLVELGWFEDVANLIAPPCG